MTYCKPKAMISVAYKLFLLALALLLCITTRADQQTDQNRRGYSVQMTAQDLIWPWPQSALWPSIPLTKNYEFDAILTGFQVVEDTSYSFTQEDLNSVDSDETRYIQQPVEYSLHVKVDSTENRAMQQVWTDLEREDLVREAIIDFDNARVNEVYYFTDVMAGSAMTTGECQIVQLSGTAMSISQVLNALWTPSADEITVYMGHQCLPVESGLVDMPREDVMAFYGNDAEGMPWWTYIDAQINQFIGGISGSPQRGTSQMTMKILQWTPRKEFSNSEFYIQQCQMEGVNYQIEMVQEELLPLAEFGLNMM